MTNPTSYTDEQVLAIAMDIGMSPSRAAVKYRAIAGLLEHMVQERQRLQAELDALRSDLRGKSDKAYCDYIRQMSRTECLGWEAKVRAGRFTEKELAAHTRAGELLGRHRALHEAAQSLPRATPNETKETGHGNDA